MGHSVPVDEIASVLWCSFFCREIAFGHAHVDNPSLVLGMDQLVLAAPLPVLSVLVSSLTVDPADEARYWDPEQ